MAEIELKDQHGRTLYHRDSHGFWSVCEYPEIKEGYPVNVIPTVVFHKWSKLYING